MCQLQGLFSLKPSALIILREMLLSLVPLGFWQAKSGLRHGLVREVHHGCLTINIKTEIDIKTLISRLCFPLPSSKSIQVQILDWLTKKAECWEVLGIQEKRGEFRQQCSIADYYIYQPEIAIRVEMKENCTPKDRHEVKEVTQQLGTRACSSTKADNLKTSQQGHKRQITSHELKVKDANKQNFLQEAESGEGSYRPSILDEYRDTHKKHPIQNSHVQHSDHQRPSQTEQSQQSPRLTRFSEISRSRSKQKTTTISILQMLENASENRRLSLMNSFKSAIKQLSKGVLLQKYCYNKFKVESVVLTFSEDCQFMSLFLLEKSEMKVYSMKLFSNVLKGLKTHRFYEYRQRGYQLRQEQCFSLHFQERTFDFSAQDKQICEEIIKNIKLIQQNK